MNFTDIASDSQAFSIISSALARSPERTGRKTVLAAGAIVQPARFDDVNGLTNSDSPIDVDTGPGDYLIINSELKDTLDGNTGRG